MTYAELGEVRGTSPASAKRLVQRHRWGRQIGNDGVTRVTVPLSALATSAKPAQIKEKSVAPDKEAMSPATGAPAPVTPVAVIDDVADDVTPVVIPATDVLARAVEALREQLAKADQREELERRRAEHQLEIASSALLAERERADEFQAALTEERRRVEDGRKRIDELQQRVDELQTALADAVTAERIAAGEAAALRAIVTGRRARPWWRGFR